MTTAEFSLNSSLDLPRAKRSFEAKGRVEIRDFLAPGLADRLRAHLLTRADWRLVLNAGGGVYEIARTALAGLDERQRRELDERVLLAARKGFQYRFETIRVPDDDAERVAGGSLLDEFVRFMSSAAVLDSIREITGADELQFADGQATSYSAGHFLTRHDDDVADKHRRAAYVFGLQPEWNADWGGLLMFHGHDGNVEEAFTPSMGALRLFSVPSPHSVSYVAPFASAARLSVTGWFRAHAP